MRTHTLLHLWQSLARLVRLRVIGGARKSPVEAVHQIIKLSRPGQMMMDEEIWKEWIEKIHAT